MKQHWTKFTAALLLAATAASAQSAGSLDAIFEGGKGFTGLAPVSLLPVVRETKSVDAPRFAPVRAQAPAVSAPVDMVALALEVEVPADAPQTEAVTERIARLSHEYLFYPDPSFDPVRLVKFRILPFPPLAQPQADYLVRGMVPAPRVESIKSDGSIKNVYADRAADPKALEELVLRYGKSMRRERGVSDVYVGFDCGVKGVHQHIMAHHPAIVVETDGAVGVKAVRNSIFQDLPALALEPIVFVQK